MGSLGTICGWHLKWASLVGQPFNLWDLMLTPGSVRIELLDTQLVLEDWRSAGLRGKKYKNNSRIKCVGVL